MQRVRYLLPILLMAIVAISVPPLATAQDAPDTDFEIISYQPFREITSVITGLPWDVTENRYFFDDRWLVSDRGDVFVWHTITDQRLCTYTFASGDRTCYQLDIEQFDGFPPYLSEMNADATEFRFITDVGEREIHWLYRPADNTAIAVTAAFGFDQPGGPPRHTWNHTTGEFFTLEPVAADDDSIVAVDVWAVGPGETSQRPLIGLDIVWPANSGRIADVAVSPDGTQLAILVGDFGDWDIDGQSLRLWVYDLDTQSLTDLGGDRVLADINAARAFDFQPSLLHWTRDGSALIGANNTIGEINPNAIIIDVATGDIAPYAPNPDDIPLPSSDFAPAWTIPSITPDGQYYFYRVATDDPLVNELWMMPLTINGSNAAQLITAEFPVQRCGTSDRNDINAVTIRDSRGDSTYVLRTGLVGCG